ncbi:MAG: SagB family peptide dehydrogenase [Gaiellaceae bacterium]
MSSRRIPSVNLAEPVYGHELDLDDPAEILHEASKLQPTLVPRQLRGVWALERNEALQASTARAVRRNPALPRVPLPEQALPPVPLATTLRCRRTPDRFGEAPLQLVQVAALLSAGYGISGEMRGRGETGSLSLRTAPSAGALYPLELFVSAQRVDGLHRGLYHYDPLDHALERLEGDADAAAISPQPDAVDRAAAIFFVAAVFWRSRFKYGLRAYRFTLLEAGHVAQNVLLAATALGLGSIVLGGFYDSRVDSLLGLDGVNESTLVAVCLGRTPR